MICRRVKFSLSMYVCNWAVGLGRLSLWEYYDFYCIVLVKLQEVVCLRMNIWYGSDGSARDELN